MHKNLFKRGIALLLTLAVVFSMAIPVGAVNEFAPASNGVSVTEIDFKPTLHSDAAKLDNLSSAQLPEGIVRVSIVLERESTLEHGFATYSIARNNDALMYRDMLAYEQEVLEQDIESMALNGADLDVVWNLTLAANIISANVDASKIEAIKAVPGVKDVVLETRYEPAVIDSNLPNDPNMATSSAQIGSTNAWAAGYTGAGSKVAIIDTGIDDDHELFQPEAFEYSYDKQGLDKSVLLTQNDVIDLYDKLNISKYGDLDSSKLYLNSKVPFAYNYVDRDLDINHDITKEEHGSHVSGIAAANSYVKKNGEFVPSLEEVHTQGVAPDAQIVTMKVFGKKGGAYDSDYMVAIEDAIILGCDSINLSLGSSTAGFTNNYEYVAILNKLIESDAVVVMSAGNNGAWADESYIGRLYGDDVNFHTGGSPGTYTNALGVASVDNAGSTGNYFKIGDTIVFYTETSGYGNPALTTLAEGNYDFVYVDGVGTDEQFAEVDVEGKVALCNRGSINFSAKANAAAAAGAAAVIIVNNAEGTISMDLSDYKGKVPVVSITLADGKLFKTNESGEISDGSKVYTGTYTSVGNKVGSTEPNVSSDGTYTMSDFSSWGVPGTLEMKPEITAPGGNIYSVNGLIPGGQGYENMSGTSMAAPQITGMAAVLGQYIREEGLAAKTGYTPRQLINSLLMSTAVPVREEGNDRNYYSILKQGAGLANVGAATSADSVIMMAKGTNSGAEDGKVKVELGEDAAKVGAYDYSFTITNISDRDNVYRLTSEFFTQDLYQGYLDTYTVPVAVVNQSYYIDGQLLDKPTFSADVDKNGVTNSKDADAILEYAVGNLKDTDIDLKAGDVNGDGKVTSYDAALLLQWIETQITVKAGKKVTVKAHIELDKSALDAYVNGAYVEGFTTISPVATSEGEMDVTYSIPVLGFYGNWSDASMFDRLNYQEYLEVAEGYKDGFDIYPYVAPFNTIFNTIVYHDADANADYVDTINPYNTLFDEWDGHTERRAIRSKDGLTSYQYTLIRNAGAIAVVIKDANGNVLDVTTPKTQEFAAFYYASQGKWMYDNGAVNIGTKIADLGLAEGDKFTVELVAIPELYTAPVADDSGNVSVEAFVSLLNKIGKGAVMSTSYTVDDTSPSLVDAEVSPVNGDLTVTMQDNQYVAGAVIYTNTGSYCYLPTQETEGGIAEAIIPADDLTDNFVLVVVDYAGNIKAYMVDLDNDIVDDDVKPVAIDIPDEVRAPLGGSSTVTVSILPSFFKSIDAVWEVADPTIATVSDGVITGLALGETTVTVTSVENPALTDTAVLKVVEAPSQVLNGLVYNADSKANWSTFNTGSPANFTEFADGAYYFAGTLEYLSEYLFTHDGTNLYAVRPSYGYAAVDLGGLGDYTFPDAAPTLMTAMALRTCAIVAPISNSGTIMVLLPLTGGVAPFDFSKYFGDSNVAAIAFSGYMNYLGNSYDIYHVLLENGTLWNVYIAYDASAGGFSAMLGEIGDTGLNLSGCSAADGSSYASMLYSFDNSTPYSEILYLSTYAENDPTNTAYINVIEIDYNEEFETVFCGSIGRFSFGDNVWPAVSLFDPADITEESAAAITRPMNIVGMMEESISGAIMLNPDAKGKLDLFASIDGSAAPIEPAAPVEPIVPEFIEPTEPEIVGTLNSVPVADTTGSVGSSARETVIVDKNNCTVTVVINAQNLDNMVSMYGGHEYLRFVRAEQVAEHFAYRVLDNGKVLWSYANGVRTSGTIAKLVFSYERRNENILGTMPILRTDYEVNSNISTPADGAIAPSAEIWINMEHNHVGTGWFSNGAIHFMRCRICGQSMASGVHVFNGEAKCLICGYTMPDNTPVVPDVDVPMSEDVPEIITIDTPTEAGDNPEDVEGDDVNVNDTEAKPQPEKNPGTGLALAVMPMLAAAAAAVIFKRR